MLKTMPEVVSVTNMQHIKEKLKEHLIAKMEADLRLLVSAAVEAREAAIHEESKAEDKYDTRGLEASYLAGAQAKRAAELSDLIKFYKSMPLQEFNSSMELSYTALVEVECQAKKSWFFIIPKGGGLVLDIEDKRIQIITPVSTMGEELLGRRLGEEFEVELMGQIRQFQVTGLF